MIRLRRLLYLLVLVLAPAPAPAQGQAPEVVASIAPVHSLVARVMQGAGTPKLLLPPGASPHDYALRPSDAAALEAAAVVVWTGPGAERWLERPVATLADQAMVLRLDQVPGLTLLAPREGAAFGAHDDDHGHGDHGQGDNAFDPHLWLDPENALLWLDAIAAALSEVDPAQAATYRANAVAGQAELAALADRIAARMAPLGGRPFVVLHDAFHYFEHRFGVEATGAIQLNDARPPGPARLAEIRGHVREAGVLCLFREPQQTSRLIDLAAEGSGARTGILDPLGADLAPGPALYPALLEGIAAELETCLD